MEKRIDVGNMLRKRYQDNRYVLMREVHDFVGHGSRVADFMLMDCWPAKGLHLHGIEVKKSRLDWLKELREPQKSSAILQYCDKFWLLSVGENIVKPNEIPENWGWMEIIGRNFFIRKEAPVLSPLPMTKQFISRLLKKAHRKDGYVTYDDLRRIGNDIRWHARYDADVDLKRMKRKNNKLTNAIQKYREATGIDITKWQPSTQ